MPNIFENHAGLFSEGDAMACRVAVVYTGGLERGRGHVRPVNDGRI